MESKVAGLTFAVGIHDTDDRFVEERHCYRQTVKASEFGSHGNFGPFFSGGIAIIKTRPTEK
jgi:hypothetical protein